MNMATKSVSVEATECEQLAHSRHAAATWSWIELATSGSQVGRPAVAPPRHAERVKAWPAIKVGFSFRQHGGSAPRAEPPSRKLALIF